MIEKLGIIDFRNIIRAIREFFGIDFSDYALTSFKRRLERVIQLYNLNGANELIIKLKDEPDFFEIFLKDISVEDTEMFRDPTMWRELREIVIPKFFTKPEFRIWMPSVTTGEEVFSLAIILREMGIQDDTKVIVTSLSKLNLETVKAGLYDMKKMEMNLANYKRAKTNSQLNDYFEVVNNKAQLDVTLLKNFEFVHHNLLEDKPPARIKMIIYRNKIIYFNLPLQNRILDIMYNGLMPGGIFVIGVKESIENFIADRKFILINDVENIHKKALV